jgi:hypothetical protein
MRLVPVDRPTGIQAGIFSEYALDHCYDESGNRRCGGTTAAATVTVTLELVN